MNALAGTATLARLAVRRDRVRISAWIIGLAGLVVVSAWSIVELYDTPQSLREFAAIAQDNPAFTALNGHVENLTTLGGRVTYEVYVYALLTAGLMSFLLVVRHTRGEEESGRTELLRAGVVGTHAQPAAALAVVAGVNLFVGGVTAVSLTAMGLPVAGSVAIGAGMAAVGLVFAAIGALAAQIARHGRSAGGLAGAVLGGAYALRAAGDVGNEVFSWLSPIGWGQQLQPYAGNHWWTLVVPLAAAAVLTVVAFQLIDRRDVGAGLLSGRAGPANASRSLSSPVGLAVRMQRGVVLGWVVGLAFVGAVFGTIGQEIEELLASTPELADAFLASGGGSPTESYFAAVATMLSLAVAGYVVQALQRMHGEERDGRAELLLSAPVSRWAWAGGHIATVAVGSVVVAVAAGAATGLVHALRVGEWAWIAELAFAMLVNLPAVWTIAAVALLLYGASPRLAVLAWAAVAGTVVVAFFAEALQLPDWVVDLSPFSHVPAVPAVDLTMTAPLVLSGVAVALGVTGLGALRRRDLTRQ